MDLSGIIAISGKGGLYTVVGQSKNSVIVQSVTDGKKFPAYASNRISALEDISIYTYEGDELLSDVYRSIYEKEDGGKAPSHKDDINQLRDYLRAILPEYDEDRVYGSDIKKLFQWYNFLHDAEMLKLKEEKTEEAEETEPEASSEEAE